MTHHSAAHRPQAMNECIDNCTQCHAICLETINYCLTKGGVHAAPEHIALLATCADTCATSADAMLRGRSEEHTSELQSLMRISYAVFCLEKKTKKQTEH